MDENFQFFKDTIKEHKFFTCYAGYCSKWPPPFCTNKAAFLKREFVLFLIISSFHRMRSANLMFCCSPMVSYRILKYWNVLTGVTVDNGAYDCITYLNQNDSKTSWDLAHFKQKHRVTFRIAFSWGNLDSVVFWCGLSQNEGKRGKTQWHERRRTLFHVETFSVYWVITKLIICKRR
jgi:hypothetical protein